MHALLTRLLFSHYLHATFSICLSFLLYFFFFFFSNDTATTEIYTLSLHDALPISGAIGASRFTIRCCAIETRLLAQRSEEHTSELQSRRDLVCRLLLEKKKKKKKKIINKKRKKT